MTYITLATSNLGKIAEINRRLAMHGLRATPPEDLGCAKLAVEETGSTLAENVQLKVAAYAYKLSREAKLRGTKILVIGDDTGLEIHGLNGEPGVKVRRWRDGKTDMTDEEIIDYAILRMQGLVGNARSAQWHTVLSVGVVKANGALGKQMLFEGTLRGRILEAPGTIRMIGFPFASLFHVHEWGMTLAEGHTLPDAEKSNLSDHRERALDSAIPYLRKQVGL